MNTFLNNIARSFYKTPFELLLNLLGIVFLFLIVILTLIIAGIFNKQKQIKKAKVLFDTLIAKIKLTERDKEILESILKNCKKAKHLLPLVITDNYYFAKYSNPLIEKKDCTYTELAFLYNHLGMRRPVLPVTIRSTADFSPGLVLRITFEKKGRCKGTILAVEEQGLVFSLKIQPDVHEKVLLEFARISGYYQIFSTVWASTKDQVIISHSENISRIQKRGFPRKPIHLPVGIQYPGNPHFLESRLMDLSGNGARIANSGSTPRNNQKVIIFINPNTRDPLTIPGRVVRVAGNNTFFSVAFDPIKENIRDKIMRLAR